MKYTAIAFTLFSAIASAASTSSGTADDRDTIIRNLMNKVDILSAKVEAQDAELHEQKAWRTELASSLKHVKAAVAPQDKTSVRRNLRQEDEAAVEPLHYDSVLGEILYELVAKVEKIKEAVEDVQGAVENVNACLDYDNSSSTCTLGDGTSISSVVIRGGSIDVESTSSDIGLTSAGNFVADVASNIDLEAGLNAYLGTGPLDQTTGSGIKFVKGNGNALLTLNDGNFIADVFQDINLEAGTGGLSGAVAYLGTGDKLLSTGSGIQFNKGNGNALLKLNTGNFVADVFQDINLEAGTGLGSGARAYLGTGDKLFNTGSGIAINKGNGNVFLTSQAGSDGPIGRVFIESGNDGFLTGSCGGSTADVCT